MPASLAAAQPIDRIARPKVQRCGLIYGQRRARLPCETKRITFIIDTRPKQREQRAQIVPLLRARAPRPERKILLVRASRRALQAAEGRARLRVQALRDRLPPESGSDTNRAARCAPPAIASGSDAIQVDQSRGCRKCASVSIQAVFRMISSATGAGIAPSARKLNWMRPASKGQKAVRHSMRSGSTVGATAC